MKKRALFIVLLAALLLSPAVDFGQRKEVSAHEDVGDAAKSGTLAVASLTASSQSSAHGARALWVMDDAKKIVLETAAQNEFFAFVHMPHGYAPARVTHVYLNAELLDFSSRTQRKAIRSFLKRAHAHGITVEYLTGKAYWVKDSDGYASAMKRADRMISFNAGADHPSERFDGIHYDIRPYLNSKWKSNALGGTDEYNNTYQKNYIKILVGVKKKLAASGQNLTLAVDVPTWFSANATDIWNPLTAPTTPVDYIAVFNSFDTKDTFLYGYGGAGTSGGIGPNLGKSGGVPMIFAALTAPDEKDELSFAEESAGEMEEIFAQAKKEFGTSAQLKGVGVMTYHAYKKLPSGTMPSVPDAEIPAPAVIDTSAVSEPQQELSVPESEVEAPVTDIPAEQPEPEVAPVVPPAEPVTPVETVKQGMKGVRALWVWSESDDIALDSAAQNEFFSFIKAPHGDASARINRVYLSGDSFDYKSLSEKNALRAFLKKAHGQGVSVEFLTGNSKWALPGQEYNAITRCERMIAFNAETSDPSERYDGMHLDIEPYLLPEWKTNAGSGLDAYNDDIQRTYADILTTCKQKMKDSGQNTTLSVDIPTWFSKATDTWNVITSESTPLDYITFMNYFDSEATFLYGYGGANKTGGVGPNLKQGGSIPMVFGAETISFEGTTISFYEEGFAAMEKVFDRAEEVFGSDSEFAGTAVHHYRTFKLMKP